MEIDGVKYRYSCHGDKLDIQNIEFEKLDLENKIHNVKISTDSETTIVANGIKVFDIDAIDVNDNGYLLDWQNESILLDNSTLSLPVGTSKSLTATTPAGAEVVWSSLDASIATVDSTGKVTGIKEGQVTVTAQIKGSETKATCVVTVVPKGTNPPVDGPTTGDGTLYIEMVDGNIKQAQGIDVADFIKWFRNRDLDDNDNPIYKIKNAKGNFEYLVHDKVVGFEVR